MAIIKGTGPAHCGDSGEAQSDRLGGAICERNSKIQSSPQERRERLERLRTDQNQRGDYNAARSARRQHLVGLLHASGPRPVLEAMLEIEAGKPLDAVLEDFCKLPPWVYRAVGASTFALRLFVVPDPPPDRGRKC